MMSPRALKSLSIATAFAAVTLAAAAASADSIGYAVSINGLASYGLTTETPVITLTNQSTAASITHFSVTIGDTAYGFDRIIGAELVSSGVTFTRTGPDSVDDNASTDAINYDLAGFASGATLAFRVGIDADSTGLGADFRTAMLAPGATENALINVTFSNGQTLSQSFPDYTIPLAGAQAKYFSAAQSIELIPEELPTPATPVPAPASAGGGLALLTALGLHARFRKRRMV